MKLGIISILLALAGICFVIWMNYTLYEVALEDLAKAGNKADLTANLYVISPILKLVSVISALISLIFAFKAFKTNKGLAVSGILLSVVLMFITFIPLWVYMLSGKALDVNVIW